MEERIVEVLRSIGMSKTDVLVYLDLIKNFPSTAQEISERNNLYRANTYESLRKLAGKGFIAETRKENKTLFQALNPNFIKEYFKQKQADVNEIIAHYLENDGIHGKNRTRAVFRVSIHVKLPPYVYFRISQQWPGCPGVLVRSRPATLLKPGRKFRYPQADRPGGRSGRKRSSRFP